MTVRRGSRVEPRGKARRSASPYSVPMRRHRLPWAGPDERPAIVLVRVLPAQDRRGRADALADGPRDRGAQAHLRLGDLRRGRLHPGPHRAPHRADRRRHDAHPCGASHLRGRQPRRAARRRGAVRGRGRQHHAGPARRPARRAWTRRGSRIPAASSTPWSWWSSSAPWARSASGVAAFPEGHPESPDLAAGRPGAGPEAAGRRRVRDHAAVLPGRGLRAPRGDALRPRAARCPSCPGSCR